MKYKDDDAPTDKDISGHGERLWQLKGLIFVQFEIEAKLKHLAQTFSYFGLVGGGGGYVVLYTEQNFSIRKVSHDNL